MPTVRDLRCTINTRAGAMIEYTPPPEDPSDPIAPYLPESPNTHTRYVNITGCENERFHIRLNGTDEFQWSEALCTKVTADFYIDGVLVGTRPYYKHFEDGLPPSIIFGAVKKFDVEMDGGDYRGVEKRASLTFKAVAFAEKRSPNDTIPLPGVTDTLGEISVKVYRHRGGYLVQRFRDEFQHRNFQYISPAMASEKILTERDVKGRGIQYLIGTDQFQEKAPRQQVYQDDYHRRQLVPRIIDMEMVDPYQRPYVCFRFLYRTRVHLESLGLIPSSEKDSIQHGVPYGSPRVGGFKRKREEGSPSNPKAGKFERGVKSIKLSDSDDDDLVVLKEMPPEFKQRKIPGLFRPTARKEKGNGKADPEKESLFLPFNSRAPSSALPTPQCKPEKNLDLRIVYKEEPDGLFVAIREPVTPTKRLIYFEDEAGNLKQAEFGADSKPMPMGIDPEIKDKVHPPEAGSVSGIHKERADCHVVNASSASESKPQSTVSQYEGRDFIGFDEAGAEDFIPFY
ncbi:hypothetical protein EV426DRAFT_621393 [Tirmania nivea]|nr:hypothetical protein EV426DRAFT_621393 [Tirmania nivea]